MYPFLAPQVTLLGNEKKDPREKRRPEVLWDVLSKHVQDRSMIEWIREKRVPGRRTVSWEVDTGEHIHRQQNHGAVVSDDGPARRFRTLLDPRRDSIDIVTANARSSSD